MDALNTLDLGMIAVVGVSAIFGVMRGFVRESLSLVTWVVALFVATVYASDLANYLTVVSLLSLRYLIAFLLLVLLVLILGGLLSHFISRLIMVTGFSVTDRIVGTLFGLVRGALILAIALLVVENAHFAKQNPLFQQSVLLPQVQPLTDWIKQHVPADLMQKLLGQENSSSMKRPSY